MISNIAYSRKKKHASFQNFILLGVFLVIFLGVVGALFMQNVRIYQKRSELQQRENDLRLQIEQLQNQKAALQSAITENQTQDYQEKVLREQGLYKKPGEEVVTVLPPKDNGVSLQKETQQKIWWDPRTWFKGN
ncbi:MAG: septum formation initiator family protein [Candidatus Wildermuthbacteria bacterium]|nr:septum formation initiator family protein [Candidatus Wildermuthbacteria bacterium]